MNSEKQDRGIVEIDEKECKGCGLCVEACVPHLLSMSAQMNRSGFRTATYAGLGCTGCGICSMVCPEPGAITVFRLNAPAISASQTALGGAA